MHEHEAFRKPRSSGVGEGGHFGGLPRAIVTPAWCGRALVIGCLALLACPVEASEKFVDSGNKQRIDTRNSLQLRAEQEAYRQSVEPRSPTDRQNLELQLQLQQLQQRNLQLRQDQRLQAERHEHRINPSVDPYRLNRSGPSYQRPAHQQQQQRLQMQMQRNTWPYPRTYFPRK